MPPTDAKQWCITKWIPIFVTDIVQERMFYSIFF